jgi:phytoene dehydrogenase-like protein
MTRRDVIIVGGGLAGLCCARSLQRAGIDCVVLEAEGAVGGRVRTDVVDGFLLDRGFQVLLTAYPECREVLDYEALDLRPFTPGALIRVPGRFCRLADPWRQPTRAVESLLAPVGTLTDKLRVGLLRRRLRSRDIEAIFAADERSTLDYLHSTGFSSGFIERFFRPFLGGVFLESDLVTSSRMFEFLFKMFAAGDVAVPNRGMQAIPEQITASLPPDCIRTGSRVEHLEGRTCRLSDGETLEGRCVVIATDGTDAASLDGTDQPPRWSGTTCLYYDALEPPVAEPVLVLNGEGRGPINSLTVMSEVAEGYSPAGRSLVSVSVTGTPDAGIEELEQRVRQQLADWYGKSVDRWRLLRTYAIPRALPAQPPGVLDPPQRSVEVGRGVFRCGDHVDHGSIHGAMVSGRRAAEAVLDRLAA